MGALNTAVRGRVRAVGALGRDVAAETERGPRSSADGDPTMFLKNERALGLKNGTVGTVESVSRLRRSSSLTGDRFRSRCRTIARSINAGGAL